MSSRNSKKQSLAVVLGMATVVAGATEPTLAAAFLNPSTTSVKKTTTALKMSSWADSNVDTNKKAQARETGAPLTPFRSSSRANGAVVYDPDTYYDEQAEVGSYDSHLNIAARKNDASQMAAIPTLRPNTEPAIRRKGDTMIVDDPAASIPKLMPNTEPAFARSKMEAAAPVKEEEESAEATKEKGTNVENVAATEEVKENDDAEEKAEAVEAVADEEQAVKPVEEKATAEEEPSIAEEEKEEEVVAEAAPKDFEEVKDKEIVAEEETTPTEPVYYEPKAPSRKQTASTTRPFFPAVRIESDVERTGITLETNRIKSAFRPRDIPGALVYDPQTGLVEAAQTEEDPYEAAAKKGVVVGGDNRSNSPAGTFAVDSYSDPKRSFFPGVRIESDVSRVGKTKEVNRIKSPFEPNRPKTAQLYDPAASSAGASSWKDQMKASAFGYDSGSSAAQERRPFFPAVTIESDVNQVGETKEVNRIRSPFRGRLVPGAKVYNSGEEQQQP